MGDQTTALVASQADVSSRLTGPHRQRIRRFRHEFLESAALAAVSDRQEPHLDKDHEAVRRPAPSLSSLASHPEVGVLIHCSPDAPISGPVSTECSRCQKQGRGCA